MTGSDSHSRKLIWLPGIRWILGSGWMGEGSQLQAGAVGEALSGDSLENMEGRINK